MLAIPRVRCGHENVRDGKAIYEFLPIHLWSLIASGKGGCISVSMKHRSSVHISHAHRCMLEPGENPEC
jgi:hypothetical protein